MIQLTVLTDSDSVFRVQAQENTTQPAVASSEDQDTSDLEKIVRRFKRKNPGGISVYIEHLESGQTVSYKEKNKFNIAELDVPFYANQVFQLIDQGRLNKNQYVDRVRSLQLGDCLKLAITTLDTNCSSRLRDIAEIPVSTLKNQGYGKTKLGALESISTSKDIGTLYRNIESRTHLTDNSAAQLTELLLNQLNNDRIPQKIPGDVPVAHMATNNQGRIHDGGIVYSPHGNYIIVVLTEGWKINANKAYKEIADFSDNVYDYFAEN